MFKYKKIASYQFYHIHNKNDNNCGSINSRNNNNLIEKNQILSVILYKK